MTISHLFSEKINCRPSLLTGINRHSSSAALDLREGSTSLELGVVKLWVLAFVDVGAIFTVGERTVVKPSAVIRVSKSLFWVRLTICYGII